MPVLDQARPTDMTGSQMWSLFLYFENEPHALRRLQQAYDSYYEKKEANKLAYNNTFKMIYFLKQGKSYFQTAEQSERMVQPLLLFYGSTALLKALLLFKDAHYPRTTAVLQHGLTTRKKKKKDYQFLDDEIKIQKEGFVPHFSKNYLQSPLVIHQKYRAGQLLSCLPEVREELRALDITVPSGRPSDDGSAAELHKLVIYQMLLYMLSMICRYDTEVWGDLLFTFTSSDMYIIDRFLQLTQIQFPYYILQHLYDLS
jgi:hypothetical protein